MTAGWAGKPVVTKTALIICQALLLLALRTTPIHLAPNNIIFKQQSTLRTAIAGGFNLRTTLRIGTDKHPFTLATPVFSFLRLMTFWTFFHVASYLLPVRYDIDSPLGNTLTITNHSARKQSPF